MKAILPATKEEIDLWRRQFAGMHKHVVKMPVAQKVMYSYVLRMFATLTQLYRENEELRAWRAAKEPKLEDKP